MNHVLTPDVEAQRIQVLRNARIMWAALLFGEIAFGAIVAALISGAFGDAPAADPDLAPIMTGVGLLTLVTVVPIAYFIRGQIYKRFWRDHAVAPQGYFTGNLLLWAMCEGVALFGLVVVLVTGSWSPLLVAVVAMAVQIVNHPHGRPMLPAYSPYETARRP
jgi:F0F1-type ATP synthase membrane subunit c/vacuolar-type H+-ATPase subunit K